MSAAFVTLTASRAATSVCRRAISVSSSAHAAWYPRTRFAGDDVVVVRVAVDDAAAEAGQGGHDLGLEPREGELDPQAPPRVRDQGYRVANRARAAEVPLEVRPLRGRMREVQEGPVHLPEQPAHPGEEVRVVRPRLR